MVSNPVCTLSLVLWCFLPLCDVVVVADQPRERYAVCVLACFAQEAFIALTAGMPQRPQRLPKTCSDAEATFGDKFQRQHGECRVFQIHHRHFPSKRRLRTVANREHSHLMSSASVCVCHTMLVPLTNTRSNRAATATTTDIQQKKKQSIQRTNNATTLATDKNKKKKQQHGPSSVAITPSPSWYYCWNVNLDQHRHTSIVLQQQQ